MRDDSPIAPIIVEQASHWLMLSWDGGLDSDQQRELERWQAADPEHRRAWLRLESLQGTLTGVQASVAHGVLRELSDGQRRQTLKLLGTVLLLGGSGYLLHEALPWREAVADLRTGTGERLRYLLQDGSRLALNSGSAANLRFSATERRIQLLAGELLLDTAPDLARRPLLVETAAGEIQALGTRFVVRDVEGGTCVELYDGGLELRPRRVSGLRLRAGEGCWFSAARLGDVRRADPYASDWNENRLVAERMPLGRFLAELSRHRPGVLRCDPAIAELPLTGVFPLEDTERVLGALERSLPIRVHRLTRYWVTVLPV